LLIRALEPLSGLAVMQRRRPKARRLEDFASGPGKLTLALGITRKLNGANLVEGPITVRRLRDEPPIEIAEGPRIGITKCADLPLRFWIAGNRFVSR
jgi:DNA-3-methyladenine glycosylase